MSFDAMQWALRQTTGDRTAKCVLIALGHHANGKGLAWPSTVKLAGELEVNRKAVDGGLVRLQKGGFIADSGDRKGDTGRVKVWRLQMAEEAIPIAPPSGTIIDAPIARPSGAITDRPNCPVSATQLPLQAGQ